MKHIAINWRTVR